MHRIWSSIGLLLATVPACSASDDPAPEGATQQPGATAGASATGPVAPTYPTGGTDPVGSGGTSGASPAVTGGAPPATGGSAGSTSSSAGTPATGGAAASTSDGGTGGDTPADECDTTAECQATYGDAATDCVDSQSDRSWCDCGGVPCSVGGTGGSSGAGAGGTPSGGTDGDSTGGTGGDSTGGSGGTSGTVTCDDLYDEVGGDPSWPELLEEEACPIGVNSGGPVYGSLVDVNNALVEVGPNADRPIEQGIKIHTLCNSVIPRSAFANWTRWYQEDGNTQVFRLFEGEHNVRNTRPDAARIESFSDVRWQRGDWHEWVGTYTIIKPHGCSIFQAKNNVNDWGVMLNLTDDGDIILNHRRHQDDVTIARDMTCKSFDIRVRDNGHDYEVYLNGDLVGSGYYDRPEGETAFRWGMYDGTMGHDALIFVTGATVDP